MKKSLQQLLKPFPGARTRLRSIARRVGLADSCSVSYESIESEFVEQDSERLRLSWQDEDMPRRQRKLVERQLVEYRRGRPVDVFDVFVQSVEATGLQEGSLLEVGCSSGYYAEVLAIKGLKFAYTGCDYSAAFIDLARKKHPGVPFCVADATALNFADEAFDIVVSGCCLLHIPEFDKAIAETARVAKGWAIFHRTPVVRGVPDQYYRKRAYGVETIEIHFNEDQLLERFVRYGLKTVQAFTLDESRESDGVWRFSRTNLCRKVSHA